MSSLSITIPEKARQLPRLPEERWSDEDKVRYHFLAQEVAREYVFDFDMEQALLRLGFGDAKGKIPKQTVTLFKRHWLVMQYIKKALKTFNGENSPINEANILAALWREANTEDTSFHSNASSRVKALSELKSIFGMDAPKKVDVNHTGIVVVPAGLTMEEFEMQASQQQDLLKQKVIDVTDEAIRNQEDDEK